MKKVRFGIVGVGNIGGLHCRQIAEAKDRLFELSAICDIDTAKAEKVSAQYNVPAFTDAVAMYDSGLVDAVVIATPHYWHAPQTIAAAQRGLHVLCEKPLSVTVGDGQEMVRQCKKHKVALGVMFMQRTRESMILMRKMIAAGKLGEIFRVQMIASNWIRSQEYYNSGQWRGTWDGEGGGIVMNQAPHSLDLFQWVSGLMPQTIAATCQTRWHKIEVENTVNAVCDYGQCRTGYLYLTTAEAPGMEQFVVAGTKGTLVAEGDMVRFGRLAKPLLDTLMKEKNAWVTPVTHWEELAVPANPLSGQHINVTRAFAKHILKGTPMVCGGEEGLNELQLANAIYVSGFGDGDAVSLPVAPADIEKTVARLEKSRSTGRGGNLRSAGKKMLAKLLA